MRVLASNRSSQLIHDYVSWWAQHMRDMLPGQLIAADSANHDALIVDPDPGGTTVSAAIQRDRHLTLLGRFALDPAGLAALKETASLSGRPIPVWLRLSAATLLEKRLTFPLAAERELQRALTYEMDRETPFTAEEVWWNWRIDGRDKQRGQLGLTLFLVPKASGQDVKNALARGGLNPSVISVRTAGGQHHQIALNAVSQFGQKQSGPIRPLLVTCLALAAVALIVPFARQSLALHRVDSRIAELQPQVDAVQQLRRRVENAAGGAAALATEQAGGADVLKVLAMTTAILPDDTHLTDFSLHGRKLSMSGQSAGAAKLIGLLATDPFFKDPAFAAAVTRVQGSKLDAFAINAEVRP